MKNFLKETLLLLVLSIPIPVILFFIGVDSLLWFAIFGFYMLLIPYVIAQLVSSVLFWYKREKKYFFNLLLFRSLYLFIAILLAVILQLIFSKEWSISLIIAVITFISLTCNNFLFLILKKTFEK